MSVFPWTQEDVSEYLVLLEDIQFTLEDKKSESINI